MAVRKVTLETICGGGVPELFERELKDVMKNIADVNTDPKKPRRITMTVDIHPSPDRTTCALEFGITSKTMPVVKMAGSLYISAKGEKFEAFTSDIRQQDIFEQDEKGESAEPTKKPYVIRDAPAATL